MKRRLFALLLLALFFLRSSLLEARILMGDHILIEDPTVEEIFTIGDEIKIRAPLKNEFIGVGRYIDAKTEINGDFIGIGFNLLFSGKANSDIYLIGSNIDVVGEIIGSAAAFGKNVTIRAPIEGNLRVSAENIQITGDISGKTILWGKEITLQGEYNNLVIYGNTLHFAPDIVIKGDLTYSTPEKIDLSHLSVGGDILWNQPLTEKVKERVPLRTIKRLYAFFSLLFPVMMMLWFFPNLFKQTTDSSGRKFLKSFATGASFIFLTVIGILVVFITIIGAPLGLISASFFFSAIYVSRVFPIIFLGRKILFKLPETTLTWTLSTLIGIFMFTVLSLIPIVKILLNIFCIPAGFGALFMGRVNLIKRLRKEEIL